MATKTDKSILGQLDSVKRTQRELLDGVNKAFTDVGSRLDSLEELLSACIMEVGQDQIVDRIKQSRLVIAQNKVAQAKAGLAAGVEQGYLTVASAVSDNSVVCGEEILPNGEVLPPGWQEMAYKALNEEYRGKFAGKAVGESVELPTGGKFTVTEIYDLDEVKLSEIRAKAAEEQAVAQAEAQSVAEAAEQEAFQAQMDADPGATGEVPAAVMDAVAAEVAPTEVQ